MWHVCGTGEVHTGIYWGNMRERGNLENLGLGRRIILILVLQKSVERAWTGLIWLWIQTSVGLL